MRIPATLAALAIAIAAATAQPAAAENERCALIGSLAVTNFFRMLAEVSGGGVPAAGTAGVTNLITLYETLGCDMEPLGATIDCAAERALSGGEINAGEVTRSCAQEAGLTLP